MSCSSCWSPRGQRFSYQSRRLSDPHPDFLQLPPLVSPSPPSSPGEKKQSVLLWQQWGVTTAALRTRPHLSELLQVELEGVDVHVEAQRGHGEQDVLPVDGLPLLLVAALAGFRRDEADELAHTLLHTLFGVFSNLWFGQGTEAQSFSVSCSLETGLIWRTFLTSVENI